MESNRESIWAEGSKFDVIPEEDRIEKGSGMRNSACKFNWPHIPHFKLLLYFVKTELSWEVKLSIYKWKYFYNLPLSLQAKLSDQDGEYKWAVLI